MTRFSVFESSHGTAMNRGDMADQASASYERDLQAGIAETVNRTRIALKQKRDEKGNPICTDCGQKISAKRLEAIPHATQCTTCKELSEPKVGFISPSRRGH